MFPAASIAAQIDAWQAARHAGPQYWRREAARDGLAEQRAQVLVDVAVPAAVVGRALRVRRVVERLQLLELRHERGPSTGRHHRAGDPRPDGVHDRGARVVDLAVAGHDRAGCAPSAASAGAASSSCASRALGAVPLPAPRRSVGDDPRRRGSPGRGEVHRGRRREAERVLLSRASSCEQHLHALQRAVATSGRRPQAKPRAGLLFQLRITPPGGSIACGCAFCGSKPRHSNWPFPFVGSPRSTLAGRIGKRPEEKYAMSTVVRVGPVEGRTRPGSSRRTKLLGRVDAPLVEVVEGERAQRSRARAWSASSRSRPSGRCTVA